MLKCDVSSLAQKYRGEDENFGQTIYVWSKVACFVLLCHVEISQSTVLCVGLLVSSESSQWIVVHWLGLRLFGAMVWKLLIIEPFSQWKLELKWNWKMNWNLGVFLVFCKALGESGLIEFLSQFSELRREIYWFLNGFCCWKL
jgi:hypothetical protein